MTKLSNWFLFWLLLATIRTHKYLQCKKVMYLYFLLLPKQCYSGESNYRLFTDLKCNMSCHQIITYFDIHNILCYISNNLKNK